MTHTSNKSKIQSESCDCTPLEAIPFLDTILTIEEGKIIVDLYKKPTDRNQYLLTSSCHPAHCVENIPFSLALRITGVCTYTSTRDTRHEELKKMLIDREYPEGMVDSAINKAKAIPRVVALKKVVAHKQPKRPTFVTFYDPRLPNLQQIQTKHWRAMTNFNPYLKEVFPEPPLLRRAQKSRVTILNGIL